MKTNHPYGEALIEQPHQPLRDTSPRLYISDGTITTEDREARFHVLSAAKGRNLSGDPQKIAAWNTALVPVHPITEEAVEDALDRQLAQLDNRIQAYMPIPLDPDTVSVK